ncbi:MAG: hypothetical protein K2O89_02105 [Clostridia bacterium]|nr:hypothetical protein [Clostridia bacterium]
MKEIALENIIERIDQLTIFELRQTARAVGVYPVADGTKTKVKERMVAIANGTAEPVPCEKKVLTDCADKQLVKDILEYRKSIIGKN